MAICTSETNGRNTLLHAYRNDFELLSFNIDHRRTFVRFKLLPHDATPLLRCDPAYRPLLLITAQ